MMMTQTQGQLPILASANIQQGFTHGQDCGASGFTYLEQAIERGLLVSWVGDGFRE